MPAKLYLVKSIISPDQPLPDPKWFWANIRSLNPDDPDGKDVQHNKFGQTLEFYLDQLGIESARLTINPVGEEKLGEGLKGIRIPVRRDDSEESLPIKDLKPPYCVIVHKDNMKNSHMLASDGSEEAAGEIDEYLDAGYRIIAIIEFPQDSDNGNGNGNGFHRVKEGETS